MVEYRTIAGTRFYDRKQEVELVRERCIRGSTYTILFGPWNTGKSEILRYIAWILSREDYLVVYIDTRRYLGEKTVSIYPWNTSTKKIVEAIRELIGLPEGIYRLFMESYRFIRNRLGKGVVWIIDEPYYLSHPRAFLEALAKDTIYTHYEKPVSTVIAVSEGSFIKSRDLWSLVSYGCEPVLVEGLDYSSFKMFIEELLSIRNQALDIGIRELYEKYTNGVPGAAISLLEDGLKKWVNRHKTILFHVLDTIEYKYGVSREAVLEFIASLPRHKPVENIPHSVIEALIDYNIVYYNPLMEKPLIKPQIPVYKTIALELLGRRDSI